MTDKLIIPMKDTGNISDGYHTFNELYYHRMILFATICNNFPDIAWKSKKHADGEMYAGMFIIGINTPLGQYSYHYHDKYWEYFKVKELENAPKWDGHKPSDIKRLLSLTPLYHAQVVGDEDEKSE